jgi:hypothetical protein
VHGITYLVKTYDVINIDQKTIHLVPIGGEHKWDKKAAKDIHVMEIDEK